MLVANPKCYLPAAAGWNKRANVDGCAWAFGSSCAGYTFHPPEFASKNGFLGFVACLGHDSTRPDAGAGGRGDESATHAVRAS
jgi:hypothetical protein